VSAIDWRRPDLRWVLVYILETGEVQRNQGNAALVDWLQEIGWLGQGKQRKQFVLNPARRTTMEERLDSVWPGWRATLADLDRAGLPHDEAGVRILHRRTLPLAALPSRLHHKTWRARFGAHSKASSTDTPLRENLTLTQDDILRIRPNRGLRLAVGGHPPLDCNDWASRFGELIIPQRAMDDGLALSGQTPRWVMTVENLGAYIDLPAPDVALIVHQPGWNSRLARRLIVKLPPAVPWWHFGDLDPEGLDIFATLGDSQRRPRLFLPSWWRDYVDSHGLPLAGGWPEPQRSNEGAFITELRTEKRWLEQEAILLDPRLPSALTRLEPGKLGTDCRTACHLDRRERSYEV